MKKIALILLICCGYCMLSFSQKDQDFILTLRKDTLFGKISLKPSEPHIVFTHRRKRVYFHPRTLPAFGVRKKDGGYRLFKSVTNALGKEIFVEVIQSGVVKLYKYKKITESAEGIYYRDLFFIGYSDDKLATITSDTYPHAMKVLLKERPKLLERADGMTYQQVPEIVAVYNRQ